MMSESMRELTESIRQQGIAEGEARGEARGKARGKAERETELVRNMLNAGIPVETIEKVSGMTAEEIEALK